MQIIKNKFRSKWTKFFQFDEDHNYIDVDGKYYWGKQASGVLLIKFINKKPFFHVTQRSEHVEDSYLWGPPGGAVPDNADLLDSAIRETVEEIGGFPIKYKVLDKYEWKSPTGNFKYTTFVILCLDDWNSQKFNWEVVDSGWYSAEEILHLDLHPAFREVLLKILPKLSSYNQQIN